MFSRFKQARLISNRTTSFVASEKVPLTVVPLNNDELIACKS
jgi:hypothetical protein